MDFCRTLLAAASAYTDSRAPISAALTKRERQLSVVVAPLKLRDGQVTDQSGAGHLAELEDPNNNRQTIVYRRGH